MIPVMGRKMAIAICSVGALGVVRRIGSITGYGCMATQIDCAAIEIAWPFDERRKLDCIREMYSRNLPGLDLHDLQAVAGEGTAHLSSAVAFDA
jgi:hypothetical protein